MKYAVAITDEAEADMVRLADFLMDRAETIEDFDAALATMSELRTTMEALLGTSPYSFRKARGGATLRRELIIPHSRTGYIALYEIEGDRVLVLAVRHQREGDYH